MLLKEAKNDVHVFIKGKPQRLSKHFISTEFDCKCNFKECKKTYISRRLVERLEDLRVYVGNLPLLITSAFRCAEYNRVLKGVRDSLHLYGLAIDMVVKGMGLNEFIIYVLDMTFPGIGKYRKHVHIDFGEANRRWTK